jgi:hypothetical protein
MAVVRNSYLVFNVTALTYVLLELEALIFLSIYAMKHYFK